MTNKIIFFLALCCISVASYAQRFEIGLGIGGTNYLGEISPRFTYQNTRLAGELFGRYNFSRALSLRANMLLGDLAAKDSYSGDQFQQFRNWYFHNKFFEGGLRFEYNFFNFRNKKHFEKWCPFLFAGGALLKSESYLNGSTVAPKEYSFAIPFGAGIKVFLSPNWNFGWELGARKTFTDRIDSVVFQEVTGATQDQDWYFFTAFSISYVFTRINCPVHYYPLPK